MLVGRRKRITDIKNDFSKRLTHSARLGLKTEKEILRGLKVATPLRGSQPLCSGSGHFTVMDEPVIRKWDAISLPKSL